MALLTRGRPAPPSVSPDDSRMTVVEHLEDLRRALIISVIGWVVATIVAFVFYGRIVDFLVTRAGLTKTGLIFTSPTGGVLFGLKIALVVGLVLAAPIIIWQAWWFVSPGLHEHEKRLVLPLILATSFFFLLGVGLALFALPLFMRVLLALTASDLHYLPFADDLFGFVLLITLAFGLVFELPIALWVLGMLRIINSRWLYRNRVYWIVALGLMANLMTPGVDPVTPLIVFVPLYGFWEATTLLLKLTGH
ncbi:MAG TPA: twin-arginine translocase subunit TatC [Candidatus Dormibacteraeota bacterium]|nr:twin-arginine translocase subunit TatC [Candidatus Dormibacteraeota bacterium]